MAPKRRNSKGQFVPPGGGGNPQLPNRPHEM